MFDLIGDQFARLTLLCKTRCSGSESPGCSVTKFGAANKRPVTLVCVSSSDPLSVSITTDPMPLRVIFLMSASHSKKDLFQNGWSSQLPSRAFRNIPGRSDDTEIFFSMQARLLPVTQRSEFKADGLRVHRGCREDVWERFVPKRVQTFT